MSLAHSELTLVGTGLSRSWSRNGAMSAEQRGQRRDWLAHTPIHSNWTSAFAHPLWISSPPASISLALATTVQHQPAWLNDSRKTRVHKHPPPCDPSAPSSKSHTAPGYLPLHQTHHALSHSRLPRWTRPRTVVQSRTSRPCPYWPYAAWPVWANGVQQARAPTLPTWMPQRPSACPSPSLWRPFGDVPPG